MKYPSSTYSFDVNDFKFYGTTGEGTLKARFKCGAKVSDSTFVKCTGAQNGSEKWMIFLKKDPASACDTITFT